MRRTSFWSPPGPKAAPTWSTLSSSIFFRATRPVTSWPRRRLRFPPPAARRAIRPYRTLPGPCTTRSISFSITEREENAHDTRNDTRNDTRTREDQSLDEAASRDKQNVLQPPALDPPRIFRVDGRRRIRSISVQ